jgi:DNA-binding MarR family transcriptional regulator
MPNRFDEPEEATDHFYDRLNLDVSYMSAMWGAFTVGHLLGIDLDRVCRLYGLSIADVNAIGALRDGKQLRATDLAQRLHVSNAVLSPRIAKLEKRGFLLRIPSAADRRAFELKLTPKGAELIEAVIADISRHARFVRSFHRLSEQDRKDLARIMGALVKHME